MLFNSFEFLIFFPLVTTLFYLLSHRFRWMLLLVASGVFYCYFIPAYLLILLLTILIDYIAALKIEQSSHKRFWLVCSIIGNLGILGIFKYYNFFAGTIASVTGFHPQLLRWALPIGLSFHTFQAMSYTIEVYRGNIKAERHAGIYALYVLFYPQLVAGPIERPQHVLHQFKTPVSFSYDHLLEGFRLMAWGFFKKLVIADRAAIYVNIVYSNPTAYHPLNVLLAILLFAIQIYGDFSGYSDIARGAAKCMGYNLMINFDRPYFASNIREFWRRWHISLSSWFRDYVYIPLGGSRQSRQRTIGALLIVFCLSGIWHGAGWNFLIWGFMHACFVIAATLLLQRPSLPRYAGIVCTNLLVAYAFVFFRMPGPAEALAVIRASIHFDSPYIFNASVTAANGSSMGRSALAILLACILFMFVFERFTTPALTELRKNLWTEAAWFTVVIIGIVLFGEFSSESFIYFQF